MFADTKAYSGFAVPDLAAARKFYGETLGLRTSGQMLSTAQGQRGWLRDAKRRLDERRAAEARPVPKSRRPGCARASAAWRKSTTSTAASMRLTRLIARGG